MLNQKRDATVFDASQTAGACSAYKKNITTDRVAHILHIYSYISNKFPIN